MFRLLVIGISWPPETFLSRLIKGLADAGVEVTIASNSKPEGEWLSHPRLNWHYAPSWSGSISGRLIRLAKMAARARILAASDVRLFAPDTRQRGNHIDEFRHWYRLLPFAGRRWDVIYFPWILTANYYLPLYKIGCPIVVSCRGSQINVAPHSPKRAETRERLRFILRSATVVHCLSDAIEREAMQFGLEPTKAWVIYPGIDTDFFSPFENQDHFTASNEFRIVSIGSLRWVKGYEYALLAVRYLLERHVPLRFDIIGDGPERQHILYTIHDLGLQEYVHLHGHLAPEAVRARLQQADVFLHAAVSEGFCNAVLEAQAMELPVVTSNAGGLVENVQDGVTGFVVPAREPSMMAAALAKLSYDAGLRAKMGRCGRKRVVQNFSLDRHIRQFISLFRTSLNHQAIS